MSKLNKKIARIVEDEMYALYLERGAMTETGLLCEGFTPEEIAVHAPQVAARIRMAEAGAVA